MKVSRSSSEVRAVLEPQIIVALDCERPFEWPSRHLLGDVDRVHVTRALTRDARRNLDGAARSLTLALADRHAAKDAALLHRLGSSRWCVVAGAGQALRLNGVPVARATLHDGDLIEVGRTLLMFRNTVPPAHRDVADLDGAASQGAVGMPTFVAAVADVHAAVARIAGASLPVQVRGEAGTGKQEIARAVHALSRRQGPLVTLGRADVERRPGELLAADGGTLLLHGLASLPVPQQAALGHALRRAYIVPRGGRHALPFDARVVTVAARALDVEAATGKLHAELHALLAGPTLALPRLSERREDLGLLIAALLRRKGSTLRLETDAGLALFRHAWPGNVRQLERSVCALVQGSGAEAIVDTPPAFARAGA